MLKRGHDELVAFLPVETAHDLLHGAGGVGLDAELLFLDVEHSRQSAAGGGFAFDVRLPAGGGGGAVAGLGFHRLAHRLEHGVAGGTVGPGLKVSDFRGHGKVLPKLFNRHA